MSHGAGHIQDMINRVKQNAALKKARRGKFKGGNDYSKTHSVKTEYNLPNVSNTELELIKTKIKKEAKKENIKRMKVIIFAIVLPLIIAFLIFNYY